MKRILCLFILVAGLVGQAAWAVNPQRRVFGVKQADGTVVNVSKVGNGHFCFLVTEDGVALVREEGSRRLCYATMVDGKMCSTGQLAHNAEARTADEREFVRTLNVDVRQAYRTLAANNKRFSRAASRTLSSVDGLGKYGQKSDGVVPSIGEVVIPVIMVQFPDMKFLETTTIDKVSRTRNESGYSDEVQAVGSVRDYYIAQSDSLFQPTFDVLGIVTLSKGYAYYGADGSNDIDLNCNKMIQEAVDSMVARGVDFSQYAINGIVPNVSIYHAGPGAHQSYEEGWEDYLWAHFTDYYTFKAGDVKINSYFVGCEVMQDYTVLSGEYIVTGAYFDGFGVFVHEMNHALGLPDFYCTDYSVEKGTPDIWSVMDYGQYLGDTWQPIGFNAYERAYMGWLDVKQLGDEAQHCTLYPFGSKEGPTAYCIKNPANEKEYFLLENRQPSTWYPENMGHGMLITHVDYNSTRWYWNDLNNDPDHLRFTVVHADNTWDGYYDGIHWSRFQNDLFPGGKNVTSFTDDTTPASDVFTGGKLGRPIYNITETDGVITFSYLDANETAIHKLEAQGATTASVYSIDGRLLQSSVELSAICHLLPAGVYIVKTSAGTQKWSVR